VDSRFLKVSASPSLEDTLTGGNAVSSQSNSPLSSTYIQTTSDTSLLAAFVTMLGHSTVASESRHVDLLPIHRRRKMNGVVTRHSHLVTFVPHTSNCFSQLLSFRLQESCHQRVIGFTTFGLLSPTATLSRNRPISLVLHSSIRIGSGYKMYAKRSKKRLGRTRPDPSGLCGLGRWQELTISDQPSPLHNKNASRDNI